MDDTKNNSIDKYYSSIDKIILNNLCENENLKNLINLSTQTNLYIFNKKNNKWILKSKNKLIKECNKIKKKELKNSLSMLSNLAKLNVDSNIKNNQSTSIKYIYLNLENKIDSIEKIIDCVNNLDTNPSTKCDYINIPSLSHKNDYIECYSNC